MWYNEEVKITDLEDNKILSPKLDVIFKMLFGDKRNLSILIAFLKSVLNIPEDEYMKITIVDTHLKKESKNDKLGIVDIRVTTKSGEIIHIELQIQDTGEMPKRIVFYNDKIFVSQLNEGDAYGELHKVITILIADFNVVNNDDYHNTFWFCNPKNGTTLTDVQEIHTLELKKIPQESDGTEIYDWLSFLKAEEEAEFEVVAGKDDMIGEAYAKLKILSEDEENRLIYEDRLKKLRDERSRIKSADKAGEQRGIDQGRQEGEQNKAIEIAKNLLISGCDVEFVVENVELNEETVRQLQQEVTE